MDMKRILESFDKAATKPKVESGDMTRFVKIVSENNIPTPAVLMEDNNKLTQAEIMTMQHYQDPAKTKINISETFARYIEEAEEELAKEQELKELHYRMYGQQIAQRVIEADPLKIPQKPRQGPLRTQTGAGQHRDKKKEQKQGQVKHKNKEFVEGSKK
jgi:hypothetical protein